MDVSSSCVAGIGSSFTWSHTVGNGAARLLLVDVTINQSGTVTASSVTYNGVALTLRGSATFATNARAEVWYLIAPPTGAHDVVVTLSGNARTACGATSYSGVDQADPLSAAVTATGTTNAPTTSVNSAAGNLVHDVLAARTNLVATWWQARRRSGRVRRRARR